ncbi:redox-sensitive transcriptional activator SoxR [Ahrensia sp. R2A130]|uniref:redox-sensitive transcriptional activator SoxR n=1 Tax=Ahrensia sp. R2A130 TaxID=744979 RepID=UPI0001E0E901|nr:redox-sensitive transcriptional activator SoxR [Ahrensia sp. R2A130]EFL88027.1 redox-sensitive transcriptional activator SoxR [Ahrensia sp. R2A130]
MTKSSLQIGDVAARTGLSVSAIRFYEERGLVHPDRSMGGRRVFERADIRRLSFIRITQELGFSISQIAAALDGLPQGRTPTKADWAKLSTIFRADLDRRIEVMTRLRDRLDGCIGCGCLSLEACHLYNPEDREGAAGTGARLVLSRSETS